MQDKVIKSYKGFNKEEWLPVVGYEGLYEISSIGRVKSCDKSNMEKLKQVDTGYEFNKEGYGWSEDVIIDESLLAVLEMRYGIQIALAIEYKEGSETKSIRIVTKDRKHYKLFFV